MAMNIDLKNLNMSDIKDQITKLSKDKKMLTKIGIIFGAVVLFLIIYYAILSPMVDSRKAKIDDMNIKKQETEQFTNDVISMKKMHYRLSLVQSLHFFHRRAKMYFWIAAGHVPVTL